MKYLYFHNSHFCFKNYFGIKIVPNKRTFLSPIVKKNLVNLHYITEVFFFFLMKLFFLFTKVMDVHYRTWGNTERITCKIIISLRNGMIIIWKYFYILKCENTVTGHPG